MIGFNETASVLIVADDRSASGSYDLAGACPGAGAMVPVAMVTPGSPAGGTGAAAGAGAGVVTVTPGAAAGVAPGAAGAPGVTVTLGPAGAAGAAAAVPASSAL